MFSTVLKLDVQASDGAKRCLLDYTLQRTSGAEGELEGLGALLGELVAGGSAGERAAGLGRGNDEFRAQAGGMTEALIDLNKKAAEAIAEVPWAAACISLY